MKSNFDDVDTDYYLKGTIIFRDPELKDVLKMFKDWWNRNPRKFFDSHICTSKENKK